MRMEKEEQIQMELASEAENFWSQIHSKVIARRKMGVQQIPNF